MPQSNRRHAGGSEQVYSLVPILAIEGPSSFPGTASGSHGQPAGAAHVVAEQSINDDDMHDFDPVEHEEPLHDQRIFQRPRYVYGTVVYQKRKGVYCKVHPKCEKSRGVFKDLATFGTEGTRLFLGCWLQGPIDYPERFSTKKSHSDWVPTEADITLYAMKYNLIQ